MKIMPRFSRTARIITVASGASIALWLFTWRRADHGAVEPGIYEVPVATGIRAYLMAKVNPMHLLLIDTGIPGSYTRILDRVAALGAQPPDLEAIVLTHWHRDHTGSLGALLDLAPQVLAYVHPIDAARIRSGAEGFIRMRGLVPRLLTRGGFAQRPGSLRPDQVARVRDLDPDAPPGLLADWGLTAIFTPGHTAGHIALYARERGVLFAGDALACAGRLIAAPPLFEDVKALEQSAAKLLALRPRRVLPGHAQVSPAGTISEVRSRVWDVVEMVLGLGVRARMK
jgi:glyoxylase-like metal-dependent hydrolase (beta-lactamase superfamily II)